jgi:tetratricopeptide (TPR) repeat protein
MRIRFLLPTLLLWLTSHLVEAAAGQPAAGTPVDNDSAATQVDQPEPAAGQTTSAPTPEVSAEAPEDATAATTGAAPSDDPLDLAEHEIQSGEFTVAQSQLKEAIADIEHDGTRYDRRLARPLTLLGDALAGQGSYSEALPIYEQARHIVRVNDGLHSPEQIEIVYREAETLAKLGKMSEATDREEYAYDLLIRNHKSYDVALVPGIMELAAWYERIDNVLAARNLYESATLIQERASGDLSPALIPPLQGLVRTYRDERFPPHDIPDQSAIFDLDDSGFVTNPSNVNRIVINRFGNGEAALAQIVRITNANPDATALDVAQAELDLADWYLLFDVYDRATTLYLHARQIMRTKAALSEQQIASYFDGTKALWLPIPDNPTAPAVHANPHQGHVTVQYTLTEHGECIHLETLESDPKGLMDFKVRRGLRAARFRPVFTGDAPVDVPDKVYRHDFTYYPRETDAAPVDRASAPEPASTAAPKKDA